MNLCQLKARRIRTGCIAAIIAVITFDTGVAQTTFTWDNWTGDSQWTTASNWSPVAVPGSLDTAVFDGQLLNLGVGNNLVRVPHGTTVNSTFVTDAAVVDLRIGDETTASKYFAATSGGSFLVGDSAGDTAVLNLYGGWLDTYLSTITGRASFNIVNPGAYWDATNVIISGDTTASTAGVGLALSGSVRSNNLDVGSDTGSGRVVVDGTASGFNPTSLWTVSGSLDVGPTSTSGFNFGQVTLQDGGRMTVTGNAAVHGTSEVAGNSKIRLASGGQLTVAGQLHLTSYGTLELADAASTLSAGTFTKSGPGTSFNWSAGTVEIATAPLYIDSVTPDSVFGSSLTLSAGKTLRTLNTTSPNNQIRIGNIGAGTMSIASGGRFESFHAAIGYDTGSDGQLTASGDNAVVAITEDLAIGKYGTAVGRLDVSAGGQASANSVWLGRSNSASGTASISGTNSRLTSGAVLAVGGFIADDETGAARGGTGQLTVSGGGTVDVGRTLIVFDGSSLSVTGSSTLLQTDKLRIEQGASFSSASGSVVRTNRLLGWGNLVGSGYEFGGNLQLGYAAGLSQAGSHTVSNNSLLVGQRLVVGYDAQAILSVQSGYLESARAFIAAQAGSDGSEVILNDSRWIGSDSLYVGGDDSAPRANGSLAVYDGSLVNATGDVRVWSTGLVHLFDSTIHANAMTLSGGALMGAGTISLSGPFANDGYVSPEGLLTVAGIGSSYEQTAAATLAIDFSSASDYGRLSVVGDATLGGHLTGSLLNSYVPQAWTQFTIVTAGDLHQSFASESLPAIPGKPGLDWTINYDYASDVVRLQVVPVFTADFDEDGDVDAADLSIWKSGYGIASSALHTQGDANSDHRVDGADYLIWQRQRGSHLALANSAMIPEPASLALALFGVVVLQTIESRRKARCYSRSTLHDNR